MGVTKPLWCAVSVLLFLSTTWFSGCSSQIAGEGLAGSGEAVSPSGNGQGNGENENEISFFTELPAGLDIAKLRLEKPDPSFSSFVLRGVIPMIEGVFPRPDGKSPFATKDNNGNSIPMQAEIVSRFANPNAGADVVEVLAVVPNDKPADANGMVEYTIYAGLADYPKAPAGVSARELLSSPTDLGQETVNFLQSNAPLKLYALDHNSKLFSLDLLAGDGSVVSERYGPVKSTVRTYGTMTPDSGGTETYFGAHAFLSTQSDQEGIRLDLAINNGPDGRDGIKPLGLAYFKVIGITVPAGWKLLNQINDPFWRNCSASSTYNCEPGFQPLVDEIQSSDSQFFAVDPGDLHLAREQAIMLRRLMLVPDNATDLDRGRNLLSEEGLGFNSRGTNADGGAYFSWWNSQTAFYFPQNQILPKIDQYSDQAIRNKHCNDYNYLKGLRVTGGEDGAFVKTKNAGPWHFYDQSGGGGTGGALIHQIEGVGTAEAASKCGLLNYQLLFGMTTDRQAEALFRKDGEPFRPQDFQSVDSATGIVKQSYKYFWMGQWAPNWKSPSYPPPGQSTSSSDDPFGYAAALLNKPNVGSKEPGYQVKYIGDGVAFSGGWDAYDPAHFIRYSKNTKALTWLANDDLAKLIIKLDGALAIGTFNFTPYSISGLSNQNVSGMAAFNHVAKIFQHSNPQATFKAFQDTGAISAPAGVDALGNPYVTNQGMGHGRAEAWQLDIANAAYRIAGPSWRNENRSWFKIYTSLVKNAVSKCSGFILAKTIGKIVPGVNQAAQMNLQLFEESFNQIAFAGLMESLWRDVDVTEYQALQNVIASSVTGVYTSAWQFSSNDIYQVLGVADPFPIPGSTVSEYNYFESFAQAFNGSISVTPPTECQGLIVPLGSEPPIHSTGLEHEETTSSAAFGVRTDPSNDLFYIEKVARYWGVYSASASKSKLLTDVINAVKNSKMSNVNNVDGFDFNTAAAIVGTFQQLNGDLP